LTNGYKTTNEDILQSIIYCYGLIAVRISVEDFLKYKDIILNAINTLLTRPVKENQCITYDNACSSYGKVILTHFKNASDIDNLVVNYLKMLPLKNCLIESEATTMSLLRMLESGNQILLKETVFPEVKNTIQRINDFRISEGEILEDEGVALMMILKNKLQI
jgi:hypothetical protein